MIRELGAIAHYCLGKPRASGDDPPLEHVPGHGPG